MSKSNQSCLAAYLFYTGNWEEFLNQAVKPFVEWVLENKLADNYFFIRYWERGPHIRLRFFGDENVLNDTVKPRLIEHFETYFKEHPSDRIEPEWQKNLPEDQKLFPNNSIQFITYEPEIERYGGTVAITTGEKQFQESSNAIFEIIKDYQPWSYDKALGAAIQMHLGFAWALGMDKQDTIDFFSIVFQSWFPRAVHEGLFANNQEMTQEQKMKETMDAFSQQFESQQGTLVPYVQDFWDALSEGGEFEEVWFNNWITGMQSVKQELINIQQDNQLVIPRMYHQQESSSEKDLWHIYDSYVHMTNNRLGILNRDEGYLGYLIGQSLKASL